MSEPSRLPVRASIEQLRKQAKSLLKQFRAGDETARTRLHAFCKDPQALADAQFVLAREYGFETWAALKRHLENADPDRAQRYRKLADDLVAVCQSGDAQAFERVTELFNRPQSIERLRTDTVRRLNQLGIAAKEVSLSDARLLVARQYGFENWNEFEASLAPAPASGKSVPPAQGFTANPPYYKINRKENSIEPRPPLSEPEWDEVIEVIQEQRITALHAAGCMTDASLSRLAELESVVDLNLAGSRAVTDAGLANLARMPKLKRLNLTGCSMTDAGLSVLRSLPELRELQIFHHHGISDAGLVHLQFCNRIERVELLGSNSGDGAIKALAGKSTLRHFKSGQHVTDEGLSLLRELPVFRAWQGGEPQMSLMSFNAEPNYLLLQGALTSKGMDNLGELHGLFALNLWNVDGSRIGVDGLKPLAALPHLGWLAFDATDETMPAIAALPRLRFLMCQDTTAGDEGFKALSRSRSLEYIWGRRCYNLKGEGFASLAKIPTLKGLSVSCKNVEDTALAVLPQFPSLVEFMPMDFSDHGFHHVGQCRRLEEVFCMYCRETGDAATEYLASLPNLKVYYAGQTQITDRSLETLSRMSSLERLTFSNCAHVTNAGVERLVALPHLRELNLEQMPRVTRKAVASFPVSVRINVEL